MKFSNSKWLKSCPTSAEQVLAIILEANESYKNYKLSQKKHKSEYEQTLASQNIFVGSIVKIKSKLLKDSYQNTKFQIMKIQGFNVKIKNLETGYLHRAKSLDFELVREDEKND